jgi:hypothetical protein
MDSVSAEKSVLRYRLILSALDGAVIKDLHTKKRGRVVYAAQNHDWHSAYLKVAYGDGGLVNEGFYESGDGLGAALRAFTEPELLNEVAV